MAAPADSAGFDLFVRQDRFAVGTPPLPADILVGQPAPEEQ
jgi:hypothetical protein